ncbi:MAG: sigma-54-dependent Fis family transcriptional regulator, partial [Kiritimatiellae bacterium]|nr:sigma-54-dependent Fis family transcriptional regulator [Kiritimatiellia bacterium]
VPGEEWIFVVLVVEGSLVKPFPEAGMRVYFGGGGGGGLADALVKVRSVLNQMRAEKRVSVRLYEGEDARLLQMTILFDAFHRWAHEYDRLIREQAAEGDRPVAARFVADVLDHLIAHGIRQAEAVRLVAIFYQLRRAYTFIQTGLVGTSPCMQALRVRLWNNIFTCNLRLYIEALLSRMEDFSTMLLGETGTGKGAAASAIGRSGFIPYRPETGRFAESFAGNFLSINLSQYPEALVESELFGHRKGAFTGAVTDHDGVFARCSPNGSIFLDEIGEVPETLQIKLLQVLQERSFSPVGSHDRKRFSGRIIAATNRPLETLRATASFRDDFYYRLCSDVIEMPTLRQRLDEDADELSRLVGSLLSRHLGAESADALQGQIMRALADSPGTDYAWPGNVRELEQALRRILVTGAYVPGVASGSDRSGWLKAAATGKLTAEQLMAAYCAALWREDGNYEEVGRRTGLDRRTVKKYVLQGIQGDGTEGNEGG